MEKLDELQKRARESLASQRGPISTLAGNDFNDDEVADEMRRIQAQDERKQAFSLEKEKELSVANDEERSNRLDRSYLNKSMGLGERYDSKLLDHASSIFPSLAKMGLSPKVSPIVDRPPERKPAVDMMEPDDVRGEDSPEDSDYGDIKKSVMRTEGGFSNEQFDKGGATNRGVTLSTLSNYLGRTATVDDLKNMSEKDSDNIFKRYYNEAGGDKIEDPRIREVLTDQNYNKGTNFLNRVNDMLGTSRGSSLSQEAIEKINDMEADDFLKKVLTNERNVYQKIVDKDPTQQKFAQGWDSRILNLAKKSGIDLSREDISSEAKHSPTNIEDLLKQSRVKEDRANFSKDLAKMRDAIIGVGAGRVIASDTSMYDRRVKESKRPLEDLVLKQELESSTAKNDPNSPISKMVRDSLIEMGLSMKGLDNVSYAQLEKLYPTLTQALYGKMKSKTDALQSQAILAGRDATRTASKDAKTIDAIRQSSTRLLTSDEKKAYDNAKNSKSMFRDALRGWDEQGTDERKRIGAALATYLKTAQQDNSVIRDSDIQLLIGQKGFKSVGAFFQDLQASIGGEQVPKYAIEQIVEVLDTLENSNKKKLRTRVKPIVKSAIDADYDLSGALDTELVDEIMTPSVEERAAKKAVIEEQIKTEKERRSAKK